jgi:hypothetical protein
MEEDWSECMDHIRPRVQRAASKRQAETIVIGRNAPRLPLALEVPPNLRGRAGEVTEIELSCAVHESEARRLRRAE